MSWSLPSAWVPAAALGVGAVCWMAYMTLGAARQLRSRPVLLVAAFVGTLPAAYLLVTWAGVVAQRVVRFERPLLALPCSLALLFVAHRLRHGSGRQGAVRRTLTELFACAAATAAALATIGIELGKPLDRLAVLVVIDRSRSIDLVPNADGRVRSELQVAELGMRPADRLGTIAFAGEAMVEDPLRPRTRLPAPQRVEVGRDATDLAEAIRRALAEAPSDSATRIAIISDGVSTRGDPLEAAACAVAAQLPIDVVPLDQAKIPDIRLVGVRAPPRASEGEALSLRIVTDSPADAQVEVRLKQDGRLLRKGEARIRRGEDVLTLREVAPGPGLHRFDVEITARNPDLDVAAEDNTGSAFVRVRGQPLALVIERDAPLAAPMVRALESAAFQVRAVGAAGVPGDVAELATYDLVTLSDVSATELTPGQLGALATYVRDLGGGLLLLGGDRSMGPGGYGKTPVEEVSPVSFDLKQDRRRASLAEVIIIDYSGSMTMRVTGGKTKLQLANEAAVRSAELLGAGDRLGVMHVDTEVRWTLPMGPVTDEQKTAAQILGVSPGGGGIFVDKSLDAAYGALAGERVNLKHVLLFADGSDAEERQRAPTLVSRAKSRGITTSVVALGHGKDVRDLERLSKTGDGRFYLIEDASRLPAVFAQETILAARSAINEVTFRPAGTSSGGPTRGIDFNAAPPLTGYVVTIPKPRAQVWLRGPEGDPILATWSVGVGRTAAFTSDYKDRWGLHWTSWDGASKLFGQLGRSITRRADDAHVRLEADAAAGQLHVRATVVDDDGRAESFRRLRARIAGPDGYREDVPLEAVGAGLYAVDVPLSRPGAFVVTAIDELGGQPVGTTGAVLTFGDEMRPTGTDRRLLGRIAELTGGKMRDTLAGIFHDRETKRFAYRSVTATLIVWAGLLLLLGVAARRLATPDWATQLPARWRARVTRRRERRAERRRAQATRTATAQALLERRLATRGVRDAAPGGTQPAPAAGQPPRPPPLPRTTPPTTSTPRAAPSPENGALQPPPPAAAPGLSAAEILLARRRHKK